MQAQQQQAALQAQQQTVRAQQQAAAAMQAQQQAAMRAQHQAAAQQAAMQVRHRDAIEAQRQAAMQAAQAEQQTAQPGPMPARLPAVVWKTATQPAEAVQAMASSPEGPRAATCIHHSVCNTCTGPSPCVQTQCPLQMVTRSNSSAGSAINPGDNAQRDPHVPLEPPPSPFRTPEPQVTVPSGARVEHTVRWPPGVHVVLSGMYADVVDYIESTDHGKVMTLPDDPGVLPQLVQYCGNVQISVDKIRSVLGEAKPPYRDLVQEHNAALVEAMAEHQACVDDIREAVNRGDSFTPFRRREPRLRRSFELIYVGWMRVIEPMIYPSSYRVYRPEQPINDPPRPVSPRDYGSGVGSEKGDSVTSLHGGHCASSCSCRTTSTTRQKNVELERTVAHLRRQVELLTVGAIDKSDAPPAPTGTQHHPGPRVSATIPETECIVIDEVEQRPPPPGKMRSRLSGRLVDSPQPQTPYPAIELRYDTPILPPVATEAAIHMVQQANTAVHALGAQSPPGWQALMHPAYASQWARDPQPRFEGQPANWFIFNLSWEPWFTRSGLPLSQKVHWLGASLDGDLRDAYLQLQNENANSLTFQEVWSWLEDTYGRVPPGILKKALLEYPPPKHLNSANLVLFKLGYETRRDRYAKVMGGLAPERDREVLLSKLGAYEEKLVSQEIERQFSEYWCKVSGLPVGVDTPAVARLVRSLHRESEIPVHKVIKRVEFNIHYVMIKVPTRWQRDLLISLLNGKATNKGTTITAVEWIYTFDAAAIFHEMEKILKKDLDRRTALEAQNLAVNAIHQSPQHQANGPYYSRFGSQRPSYRSWGYSPKGETAKGGKKGGKGGKPALGANVHGKQGAPKGEKGGADKGRGKGYRPTYGKFQGKGSGKGQPKGGRPGYAPGKGTKGAKGAFGRGVREVEAYPANASEWDEYYGDEGQYDRDGAADWDETDEIKVCAVEAADVVYGEWHDDWYDVYEYEPAGDDWEYDDDWYKTNEAWEVAEVQAEVQEQTGPSTALNSPKDPVATDPPLSN